MRYLVAVFLFFMSMASYGQTENSLDTIKSLLKENKEKKDKLDNYLKLDDSAVYPELKVPKELLAKPKYTELGERKPELNIPKLDIYQGPPLESNIFSRNPFANDYSYNSGLKMSNKLWLSSSSSQNAYPTLGSIRNVSMSINYQPVDWLVMSGGAYAAKYSLGGMSYNDTGLNGRMKFILNDRVSFNVFGQYSAYGKQNGIHMMGMYPQSCYGGYVEVKVTEKFGVKGGMTRELNPNNGKWENSYYVAPVFYGK